MSTRMTTFMTNLIIRAGALVTAMTVVGGTLWAAGDYTGVRPVMKNELLRLQQVMDQNNLILLQLRFQVLMQKKEYGGLTFQEQQELCSVARLLGYVQIPGC